MHNFVRQEINRFFSTYDGWTIIPMPEEGGYDREFVAERTISGNRESKKVLVSFEKCIQKEKIEGMRSSVTGPYGQIQKSDILVLVPQKSDTSCVPPDVRIAFMHSFSFDGDTLAWMKKPVQKPEEEKTKLKAAAK
ncbi:MAG: hypothetical protein M0Q91_10440 [Methanoregula sp.]|nr:hypothetical protein [Methanoregula sp.]